VLLTDVLIQIGRAQTRGQRLGNRALRNRSIT
jgi:hypothetical protein